MATRRSARIRHLEDNVPIEPAATAAAPVPPEATKSKRKVSAPTSETTVKKKKSVASTISAPAKTKMTKPVKGQSDTSNANPLKLPPEILELILGHVRDPSTISKLSRTCKQFHSIMIPRLHKRVATCISFHTHIPKMIEAIQPYLTIAQNKQLKKDGKYKGQLAAFPSGVDVNAKPKSADYVRELVVGHVDPGRKHEYIVHRYIEEALRNMSNLEVVQLNRISSSMATSVAALKNLKGLSLLGSVTKVGDEITPLEHIKNILHFAIHSDSYHLISKEFEQATQKILFNSRSTLRSLSIDANDSGFDFLQNWDEKLGLDRQGPDFPALHSLQLASTNWNDENHVRTFQKAVNFMGLRELTLKRIYDGRRDLYRHLADLATANPKPEIKLRSFTMDHYANIPPEEMRGDMEAISEFLGAFDGLVSLDLEEYNSYPFESPASTTGLPPPLQEAILRHNNLKTLRLNGRSGQDKGIMDPFLSLDALGTIVDGLPLLEELAFPARSSEKVEVAEVLARARNLRHFGWNESYYLDGGEPIVEAILNAILDRDGDNSDDKIPFRWETHSRLRTVVTGYRGTFEIASGFGKGKAAKGIKKPQKVVSSSGKEREVLFREVSMSLIPKDVQYVPTSEWADAVGRDLN